MDDYIRRGEAIEETCSDCTERNNCGGSCSDTDRLRAIHAADVVEVVRCRDCVHGEHYYGGVSCRMPSFPEWKVHEKDYFCADGERKEGGQDDG